MSNGNQDWFSQNAPKTEAKAGSWFEENIPKEESKGLTEKQKGFISEAKRSAPTTTIGPRTKGALSWLQDLEGDVRSGSGATLPGRILRKMGAKGTEYGVSKDAGDFISSPVLGTVHAAQGAALVPSHPWQGTKQLVSGVMEAGTIPGAIAAAPEEGGATALAKLEGMVKEGLSARKAAKVAGQTIGEWKKINKALGVTSKGVKIGEGAKSLEEAATMPGRTVSRIGLTSKELKKMSPLERMSSLRTPLAQAGQKIEAALQEQEKAGKTLDVGAKAFETLKKIPNPKIQEQAIEAFNYLVKEVGITNQRAATPTEAMKLRRALVAGSRFGMGGDLNSLGSVRAALYGAVSSDLKEAVPALKELDPAYSDLRTAMNAARSTVQKEAVKEPMPGLLKRIAKKSLPFVAGAAGGSGLYALGKKAADAIVPGAR